MFFDVPFLNLTIMYFISLPNFVTTLTSILTIQQYKKHIQQ